MKMKNLKLKIILALLLVVGLGVLIRPALAQEELVVEVKTEEVKSEYVLAYPGILPDHPFYRLKMLRDRIWGFLIRDPLKKSQWCLLMADKRIWASQLLAEKGKFDLSVSTATKAEKYLEQAVQKAYQAEEMGKGDEAFFEKILDASLKHLEVLHDILEKVPDESKPTVELIFKYPQSANQKILELLGGE